MLYIVVPIYLSQRVIAAKQPDHKQHEKAVEREKQQWDVSYWLQEQQFQKDRLIIALALPLVRINTS